MLDLSIMMRRLTQGQPLAARVLAAVRLATGTPAESAQPIEHTESASGQDIDVQELSRRVYDLMRDDIHIRCERRGGTMR